MKFRQERQEPFWTVPYLPLDPHDVNREYETDVIRINSQSGKGGISYILEHNFGYDLPKEMAAEVGYFIKGISDHAHKELTPHEILVAFQHEYQNKDVPIALQDISWIREKGSTVADATWPSTTSCTTSAPGATAPGRGEQCAEDRQPQHPVPVCGL